MSRSVMVSLVYGYALNGAPFEEWRQGQPRKGPGWAYRNNGPAPRPEPSPEPPPEPTAPAVPVADIGRRQRARAADRKARKAARHQR
jgi:hypothetical protein